MTGDIAFIRTTRFGQTEDLLASRLESAFGPGNVLCCVDESRGEVDTGRWPKAVLTRERAESLVGGPLPADWGWRMGDLCHLAVAETFGPRPRQWLVENDVHLPRDCAGLFARRADIDADFLACDLRRKPVKPIAEAVGLVLPSAEWGCIFALNRIAGERITELRAARQAVVAAVAGQRRKMPNDEAMVANLGAAAGWRMADLYAIAPDAFSPRWFATNPPMLRESLERSTGRVAHPVLSRDEVFDRVGRGAATGHPQKYGAGRLRRVLAALPAEDARRLHDLLGRAQAAGDSGS